VSRKPKSGGGDGADGPIRSKDQRAERLSDALRANLAKRKDQARARDDRAEVGPKKSEKHPKAG